MRKKRLAFARRFFMNTEMLSAGQNRMTYVRA